MNKILFLNVNNAEIFKVQNIAILSFKRQEVENNTESECNIKKREQ